MASDKGFTKAKFIDWLEDKTFDTCLLDRGEFGEFLADYLTGESQGFVLNLNGAWGTGKTEFLKRFYSLLLTRNHPCIYIDAWESDFSKEPLTVVSSELINQMERLHSGIVDYDSTVKTKQYLAKMFKGLIVGVGGVISYKLIGESGAGTSAAQQWVGESERPESFLDRLTSDYAEQVDSIKHIRESLSDVAQNLKDELGVSLPVVVLVDELDRCRPNYAIEMLEVIKHFFNTPNFVFVVASDTAQLCESIKNVYGAEFKSEVYLRRFFDRRTVLPEPNLLSYVNMLELPQIEDRGIQLYPNYQPGEMTVDIVRLYITKISEAYGYGIRDVDQLVARFNSCIRHAVNTQARTDKLQVINVPVLINALIEFDNGDESYRRRKNRTDEGVVQPTRINEHRTSLIDENLTVADLVEIALHGVHTFKRRVSHYGDEVERHVCIRRGDLSSELSTRNGITSRYYIAENTVDTISRVTGQNNADKFSLWMWDDYRKVIELAGNLE